MAWPLLSWILSSSSSDSSSYEYDGDKDIGIEEEGDDHDPDNHQHQQINENNIDHDHPHNHDVSFEATSKSNNSNATSDYTYTLSTDEPTPKRRRLDKPNQALSVKDDENKCSESRVRGRKRVWKKEDERDLLQGFLEYSTRQTASSHHNPKETASFYDQVSPKLKAEFNKSQLVQKVRRLKRKYHNAVHRMNSSAATAGNKKECFRFKSPHDKDIFELSLKIWGSGTRDQFQDGQKRGLNNDGTTSLNVNDVADGVIIGLAMNPMPLSSSSNLGGGGGEEVVDEKWRKQQILELEAYSKRLELVQHQVKAALEDLRSKGNQ